MEMDEQSRIPNPVVATDDPNTCTLLTNTLKEISSTCAFVTKTLEEIRAERGQPCSESEGSLRSESSSESAGSLIRSEPRSEGSGSRSSSPDPNDPVEPTDEQSSIKSTYVSGSRRRHGSRVLFWNFGNNSSRPARVKRRNNNDLESSSSKHYEQHQPIYTQIEIAQLKEILGSTALEADIHEPVSQCCIYKVPKDLRNINETAYTPQVISIGPLHHGNKALVEMEKQKLRYIIEFQRRSGGVEKSKEFKRFIQNDEQLIRNYYQEDSSLESSKFVSMILRDAVFIIELFLRNKEEKEDFFLDKPCLKAAIACDLQLLENQLPYLLLQNLFEIGDFIDHPFLVVSYMFLFDPKNRDAVPQPKKEMQRYKIQHFTDLRRYFLLMDFPPQDQIQGEHVRDSPQDQIQGEHVRDLPTATKLQGSGVKFKKGIEGSLEISCEYVPRAMRIPGFEGCEIRIPFMKTLELQISRLEIDDQSERLYRNMMALELCHYPSETHICNFILLMDYLINTEKDVDLFVEKEIIFGLLGDNAAVAKMFNRLGLQITPSHSVYHDIGEMLKAHYRRPWNRTMATLNTVYFGDIWKGTATVAAFILLVFSAIQAIMSILSVTL